MKKRLSAFLKWISEAWAEQTFRKRLIISSCSVLFVLTCLLLAGSCRDHKDYGLEPLLILPESDHDLLDDDLLVSDKTSIFEEAKIGTRHPLELFGRMDDILESADPLDFLKDPVEDSLREAKRRKVLKALGPSSVDEESSPSRKRDTLSAESFFLQYSHEPTPDFLGTVYDMMSDRPVLVAVLAFGILGAALVIWIIMTLILAPFQWISRKRKVQHYIIREPEPPVSSAAVVEPVRKPDTIIQETLVHGYSFPLKYRRNNTGAGEYIVYDQNDRLVMTICPYVSRFLVDRVLGLVNGDRVDYIDPRIVRTDNFRLISINDVEISLTYSINEDFEYRDPAKFLDYFVYRITNGKGVVPDTPDDGDDSLTRLRIRKLNEYIGNMKKSADLDPIDTGDDIIDNAANKKIDRDKGSSSNDELYFEAMERFESVYGNLPEDEQDILYALAENFQKHGPGVVGLSEDVYNRSPEENRKTLEKLIKKGLAIMITHDKSRGFDRTTEQNATLSPSVAGVLFHDLEKHLGLETQFSHYGLVFHPSAIFTKKLYYNDAVSTGVDRFLGALSKKHYPAVIKKMEERGKRKAITCMLYGPPGTGKTELVMQAARKTKRCIFKVEYQKLMDTYVSETEHNLKNVFLLYRYAAAIMKTTPILLINEADMFITTRMSVHQANDKIENEFQGLFLEELEQFEGILVATTNRTQDIDEAYDRRFLIKLKIDNPDEKTRFFIWKNRMPELEKKEIEVLSKKYELTGAEIENVITQFDLMSTIDNKEPGFSDLEEICSGAEVRTTGRKRQKAGYRIG